MMQHTETGSVLIQTKNGSHVVGAAVARAVKHPIAPLDYSVRGIVGRADGPAEVTHNAVAGAVPVQPEHRAPTVAAPVARRAVQFAVAGLRDPALRVLAIVWPTSEVV